MKKIASFITAVLFCFAVSVPAFADGGFVDKPVVVERPLPSTTVVNPPVSDSESVDLIRKFVEYGYDAYNEQIQGELAYFFTVLVNDKYGLTSGSTPRYRGEKDKYIEYTYTSVSCSSVRAKSGDKYLDCFDPDYLAGYFAIFSYAPFVTDYDGELFMRQYYASLGEGHGLSSLLATPPNPKDILSALSLYVIKYDFLTFSDYYNSLYAAYLKENGDSGISVGYENEKPEDYVQPIKVPAEDFKKYVTGANKHYSPKNCRQYVSFRTSDYSPRIMLYSSGNLPDCYFFEQGWRDGCYYTPFYFDGTDYYYTPYVYHDYLKLNEGVTEYHSDVEDKSDPSRDIDARVRTSQYLTAGSYIGINPFVNTSANYYGIYTNYENFRNNRGWQLGSDNIFGSHVKACQYYKNGDLTTEYLYPIQDFYKLSPAAFDEKYPEFSGCDVGFFISNEPIEFRYTFDTEKIPDTYYITVNGDTVYDYSITNPETGDTSTINEYITNNYTYITNNPGGGGGSGTTGGNVNVGGNVGVNGSVNVGGEVKFGGDVKVDVSPVDINVNVNQSGGAGEPPEIGGLDDLAEYLPEKSPVINDYLKIFFDTLPPELLGLILAGVAVAVIKLIFRR